MKLRKRPYPNKGREWTPARRAKASRAAKARRKKARAPRRGVDFASSYSVVPDSRAIIVPCASCGLHHSNMGKALECSKLTGWVGKVVITRIVVSKEQQVR